MESLRETYLLQEKQAVEKTTFVQNLAKNNLFGEITEVYWILKIELSK